MKLDLTIIKNESIEKFTKSFNKVHNYFDEMLSISLDTAIHEIDNERRRDVEMELDDLFGDELKVLINSFTKCLNKASEMVENRLGS